MANIIEIFGLTLALIDFLGFGPKLEKGLDRQHRKYEKFLTRMFGVSWRMLASRLGLSILFLAIVQGCYSTLTFVQYRQELQALWYSPEPQVELLGGVGLRLGLALLLFMALGLLMTPLLLWTLLWIPNLLIRLLNKPRSGIVGSIGLLLAIGGFVLGCMS